MSPDYNAADDDLDPVPYADLNNPQSLNLYSYVQNDPLSYKDADGHKCDNGSVGPDGTFTIRYINDPPVNASGTLYKLTGGAAIFGEEFGPSDWAAVGALTAAGYPAAHPIHLSSSNKTPAVTPTAPLPSGLVGTQDGKSGQAVATIADRSVQRTEGRAMRQKISAHEPAERVDRRPLDQTIQLGRRLVITASVCVQLEETPGLESIFRPMVTNHMRRYIIPTKGAGTNTLQFEWSESTSLANELSRPLKQVSVESEPHGWPMFVTLWRSDGTGLRVRSEMHDVAERREVGVLCFSHLLAPVSNTTFIDVAPTFDRELTISKLLIEESGTSAESGVILMGDDGDEMIIVAGVKPYCLAISGLPSAPSKFEPEYPFDRYARVPFRKTAR